MPALTVDDFAGFVREVHEHEPFPWQLRLAEQVLTTGRWPTLLDIPTGAGKTTAVVDIALFALAANPAISPRRIVFVVDRRVIVAQVAAKVRQVGDALQRASRAGGVVAEVGRRLRAVFHAERSDVVPFVFAELRGGIALDDMWTSRPDVPTVLVSTVDQVGSRLLFRGYGVSQRMRPVHAGLLGCDALFLLDEVHLSRPFAQTLHEFHLHHRPATVLPDRWQVVEMTATPGRTSGDVFRLDDRDLGEHSPLAPRLYAAKDARLKLVGQKGQEPHQALLHDVPRLATDLPAQIVGIIVNRVATAAAIAEALEGRVHQPDRVVLLTGRMRPFDRDDLWARIEADVGTGRTRSNGPRLFVVATQTIEVGADLDFDAMITEVAPVDSLRQRFGRVDRLGQLSSAGTPAQVFLVGAQQQTKQSHDDPIYGTALTATWRELERCHGTEVFDVGPLSACLPGGPEYQAPSLDAPLLLDSHLDVLVQTNPSPEADLDIARWLHGPQDAPPDVNLVWRADIDDQLLAVASGAGKDSDELGRLVELLLACPPKATEAVALPIWSVVNWLNSAATTPLLADVDQQQPPSQPPTRASRRAVRWAGANTDIVTASDIRPGDTLVVPATRGGLRRFNWDPTSTATVTDLGDRAQDAARLEPVLRLHTNVVGPHVDRPESLPVPPLPVDPDLDEYADPRTEVAAWLEVVRLAGPRPWLDHICSSLIQSATRQVVHVATGSNSGSSRMYVLRGRRPVADVSWRNVGLEFDGGDLTNSFIGRAVELTSHCDGVGALAGQFAASCGLPQHLIDDLTLAGRLHDLGKADPRFQVWLCDGDEIAASRCSVLLAKSVADHRDKRRRDQARRRAGYPAGMGHSLLSVALALSKPEVLAGAHDPDLILHLVASHHGHCRALPPPQPDPAPVDVTVAWNGHHLRASSDNGLSQLDSGVTDRFWRLNRQYGAHGLAWLEALLRLADHRRSALELLGQEAR